MLTIRLGLTTFKMKKLLTQNWHPELYRDHRRDMLWEVAFKSEVDREAYSSLFMYVTEYEIQRFFLRQHHKTLACLLITLASNNEDDKRNFVVHTFVLTCAESYLVCYHLYKKSLLISSHLVFLTVLATWPRQWSLSSWTQSLAYLEFLLGIPVTRESSVRNTRSINIMMEKEILEKLDGFSPTDK